MQHLQPNSTLQGGKYRIEKVLGQGGFGITYLAEQVMLGRKVAVKEFFMKELCERDESTSHVTLGTEGSRETVSRFREKFLKEARNIARLNHPNIVRIIDVFEENGTAYYVMEYADNGSLADKVKKEGNLSEPVATRYILQVAEALDYVHQQKMNHLDVKPANIMLNEKDESILIDFGLSKQYDAVTGGQTSSTPVGISEGYAPMEQYMQGGVGAFSPETDIYSLGATYYKLLTGITPPNASFVNNEGLPTDELKSKGVSQKTIDIIMKAMEGRKKDRTKSVRAFIEALNASTSSNPQAPSQADEATLFTPEMQRAEEERKRKEAEAKAAKEKAEAEARAKVEAERKAREEEERKRKEEEEKARKAAHKSGSKSIWLWGVIGVIAVAGIIIGVNSKGESSDNGNSAQSGGIIKSGDNASYSNGVLNVDGVTYNMVKIEGGTFTMGTISKIGDPYDVAKPAHQVTLTSNYYIGKTEVTQALWKAVMGNNPSSFKGDNLPVECVSWNDCKKFISKLNSMTGKNFRLPTEAEWEFAARGGNKSKNYLYSGSNNIEDVAWYWKNSGDKYINGPDDGEEWYKKRAERDRNNCKTHPVASKQPNELGIYDMSGNVSEWCSDWFERYDRDSQINPHGPNNGDYRITRGGCYILEGGLCCSFARPDELIGAGPNYCHEDTGLRLALSE